MDDVKQYSRYSFIGIMLTMLILVFIVDSTFYYGMNILFSKLSITGKVGGDLPQVVGLAGKVALLQNNLRLYFVPMSVGFFLLSGCLLWLYLRASFVKRLGKPVDPAMEDVGTFSEDRAAEKKQKVENDQRLFLHLLSVFQREGRLVDFFSENLEHYQDEQVGAAVRSIHESCKKTLDKYITMGAVIDADEGEEVTVDVGFDPAVIKLTGNITGDPPFKGILHHRGWRAETFSLPTLSESADPKNIAPAEVEIRSR
jgi:hypothetical protein